MCYARHTESFLSSAPLPPHHLFFVSLTDQSSPQNTRQMLWIYYLDRGGISTSKETSNEHTYTHVHTNSLLVQKWHFRESVKACLVKNKNTLACFSNTCFHLEPQLAITFHVNLWWAVIFLESIFFVLILIAFPVNIEGGKNLTGLVCRRRFNQCGMRPQDKTWFFYAFKSQIVTGRREPKWRLCSESCYQAVWEWGKRAVDLCYGSSTRVSHQRRMTVHGSELSTYFKFVILGWEKFNRQQNKYCS